MAHERMTDAAHAKVVANETGYTTDFQIGDKVLLWTPSVPRGVARKLHCRWHGPGVVVATKSGTTYLVKIAGRPRKIHEARLRGYGLEVEYEVGEAVANQGTMRTVEHW